MISNMWEMFLLGPFFPPSAFPIKWGLSGFSVDPEVTPAIQGSVVK